MQKFKTRVFDLFDQLEMLAHTFGNSTVWLLLSSVLTVLFMLVINDHLILNTREKTDALSRLDLMLNETWKTRAQLALAEAAQRGYLLTRSEAYFHPYDDATVELTNHLRHLDRLLIQANLGDNQAVQANMNELVSAISMKSAEMSVTIDFAKRHQFDKAIAVVRLDTGIKESRNIESLVKKFETSLQTYRVSLMQARNTYRTLTRWVIMVCPLVFMGLMAVVIRRLMRELSVKARAQTQLQLEHDDSVQKIAQLRTRLQGLALEAQTDIERERYELSRELHDELGSLLTAIKMDISWVIKHLKDEAPQVTEKLKKTNQYVDRSISFKREVVQNLHPAMIKNFGLVACLQNLIDEAKARNQWQVDLIMPENELALNETIALILYRIVQESLNNCSKYAKADKVAIHLMDDEQHVKLEISDNGVGMDPDTLTDATHGIKGMRHRVESVGGHYEMISAPQQGLSIRVLLPHLPVAD